MSRASSDFYFDDGDITHGIYNGTSDVMMKFMSYDAMEPWDWYYGNRAFKGREFMYVPDCKHEGEHVLVRSDYGAGNFWHGMACRDCLVFKGPFSPYEDDVEYFSTEQDAQAATPALPR